MLDPLIVVVCGCAFAFGVSERILATVKNRAVKNSRPRFLLATWRRVAGVGAILSLTAWSLLSLLTHQWFFGVAVGVLAVGNMVFEHRENDDDDTWFTGRWGKITAGAKYLLGRGKPALTGE